MQIKNVSFILTLLMLTGIAHAQDRYFTRTGKIDFFSKASLEDIKATNKTVTAVVDTKTGALQFAVQMRGFEFEKQLMQQHFNENYLETDKFPKAEFKGTITNNSEINYKKDGTYSAKVNGKLTIHGVTKDVSTTGTIKVSGGEFDVHSVFNILLSDYKVRIPAVAKDKISNSIQVTVDGKLEPLKGN